MLLGNGRAATRPWKKLVGAMKQVTNCTTAFGRSFASVDIQTVKGAYPEKLLLQELSAYHTDMHNHVRAVARECKLMGAVHKARLSVEQQLESS